jgi:hypothetical protein
MINSLAFASAIAQLYPLPTPTKSGNKPHFGYNREVGKHLKQVDMHRYLTTMILATMALFWTTSAYGQDRKKAEQAVIEYLISNHGNYKPIGFGEFFVQTYPKEVRVKMGTDREVKYSLVHSYSAGKKKVRDEYFHLDKDMKVLGQLSSQQMMDITMGLLFKSEKFINILDSMGVDSTNIQMEYKEP